MIVASTADDRRKIVATATTLLLAVVAIRLEGRRWFCECGEIRILIAGARSPHTSQHLLDPYSLTHIEHGLLLYWLVIWIVPRWSRAARFWLAILIESMWEVFENTIWVIERYRDATAALGYMGDTVVNSLGDILTCGAGLLLAPWLGLRGTIAVLVAMEIALAFWIRDNLLLNVVMLFYAPAWLKAWQLGA